MYPSALRVPGTLGNARRVKVDRCATRGGTMQKFVRDSVRNARLDHRFYPRACSHAPFRTESGRRTAPPLPALLLAAVTLLITVVSAVSAEATVLHFKSPHAGARVK